MPGSSVGHIPIDLLKTLVLIADLGGVTRAARALGISQSAVSAQLRRLEAHVAGAVFVKQGRGVQLSELGQIVSSHARRIVALSEKLQSMINVGPRKAPVRIGLPAGIDLELIGRILPAMSSELGDNVLISCDAQANLVRALESEFIDVAFLSDFAPAAARVMVEWTEPWHWVKARHFVLSPGSPVPLVGWPGSLSDRLSSTALRRAGVEYSVTFTSADRSLRKAAVRAGVGVMVASARSVEAANLCIAREYYLPTLPSVRSGIYVADSLDLKSVGPALRLLQSILRPDSASSEDGGKRLVLGG